MFCPEFKDSYEELNTYFYSTEHSIKRINGIRIITKALSN